MLHVDNKHKAIILSNEKQLKNFDHWFDALTVEASTYEEYSPQCIHI